jgi:hypothetical protein
MERDFRLALNDFLSIPEGLRIEPSIDVPVEQLKVNLATLYHHYYWDKYGVQPPAPDPAHFEYLRFLEPCGEFRFAGDGPGAHTGVRRNISMETGQALCRQFLHDQLGVPFFAHVSEIINRQEAKGPFAGCILRKTAAGNAPDYLCANRTNELYLAEAKGRFTSISFANKEFDSWRKQFDCVEFTNSRGALEALKGFVVATRFAIEAKGPRWSTIFAEDPRTPGELPMNDDARREFSRAVTEIHYGRIAQKLGQPILAASLGLGFRVPDEIRFPAIVWEFQTEPLKRRRFVGGYYPLAEGVRPIQTKDNDIAFLRDDPFRLDVGNGVFVGVQEHIFRQMASMARNGGGLLDAEPPASFAPFYSAISTLDDGSIVGPVEFFQPIGQVVF